MGINRIFRRLAIKKAKVTRADALATRDWPAFVLDASEGDPRFVEEVKKAISAFSFTELPEGQQRAYRILAKEGVEYTISVIEEAAKAALRADPTNRDAKSALALWAVTLGEMVFSRIPESVREELLPHNDVHFLPQRRDILVIFRSLIKVETGRDPFWYSRQRPSVEIDGRSYTVAFSKHAIDSIKKRISPNWMRYGAMGDVYSYFEQCVRFDVCQLRNTDKSGNPQLALTFYDHCDERGFWTWDYVTKVLGLENLDPSKGPAYHRVGYCPAFLDEDKGFIRLATLLCPGYRQTPEYGLLHRSALSAREKRKLAQLAVNHSKGNLLESQDFSAIKWFHDNGIPQVIQTHEPVYRPIHRGTYFLSERLQK